MHVVQKRMDLERKNVKNIRWKSLQTIVAKLPIRAKFGDLYDNSIETFRDMNRVDKKIAEAIRSLIKKASGKDTMSYLRVLFPKLKDVNVTPIKKNEKDLRIFHHTRNVLVLMNL